MAQTMLIPDGKNDNGKGMKGGHKEGTQKQNFRKVHFAALMDIRHIQKYEYILVNVRKSNVKCGNYQAQMKERYTNFPEKIDEAGIKGRKF